MNCIIKSWKCKVGHREEFFGQPRKRHYSMGSFCRGEWEEFEWRRQLKPIQRS